MSPQIGGSFAGQAGKNPYLYKTPMYQKLNGGLNVKEFGHNLREDQLAIATNVIFDAETGSVQIRGGQTDFGPVLSTGSVSGIFSPVFQISSQPTYRVCAVQGTAFWTINTADASGWTDRTNGRTITAGNRWWFGQINNLMIMSNGVDVPLSWDGLVGLQNISGSPPTADLGFEWNGYYFFTRNRASPNRLHYSALGDVQSWPAANFIDIPSPADGDPIMGYGFTYGNLIIYKRRSIYLVTGKVAADFRVEKINAAFGLVSIQATTSVGNSSWFVSDRGLYEIDGIRVRYLSKWTEPRWQTIMTSHALTDTKPIAVHNFRFRGQVWVSVDFDNDGTYDRVLVHDYDNSDEEGQPAVSEFTYTAPATAPTLFARANSSNDLSAGQEILLGSDLSNQLRRQANGTTDDGTAITATIKFKHLDLGDPAAIKTVRYIRSIVRGIGSSDDFRIYTTPDSVSSETTTTFSAPATANQRITAPTAAITARSRYAAFGVVMNGNSGSTKTIMGYQLEYLMTGRRL